MHMDTLAEWVAAASLAIDSADTVDVNSDVATFEFNGSTYVVTSDDSGGGLNDAFLDNVIVLMGLTDVAKVSDHPGKNTILIG
jgi:hypothetical protein